MYLNPPHTALLVFNQTPHREALRKPSRAREEALRVFSQTKAQIMQYGRLSGLEVFDSAHWTLSGETFADRLHDAVGTVLHRGFHFVLVVGIDTPGIEFHHIEVAAKMLTAGQTPVGPDRRGGAYLLAFDQDLWASNIWTACRWETPHFFSDWQSATSSIALDPVADISVLPDFNWVKSMIRFQWMLKALAQQIQLDPVVLRPPIPPTRTYHGLRAPPKEAI